MQAALATQFARCALSVPRFVTKDLDLLPHSRLLAAVACCRAGVCLVQKRGNTYRAGSNGTVTWMDGGFGAPVCVYQLRPSCAVRGGVPYSVHHDARGVCAVRRPPLTHADCVIGAYDWVLMPRPAGKVRG